MGVNMRRAFFLGLLLGASAVSAQAEDKFIVLASTTSTEQSGLFGHLLPLFKAASGISVRVVAVGTGQALDMARRGDADAVLVHDAAAEEKFVADGFAAKRWPVMHNDFVLIGPAADPAQLRGSDIVQALTQLAARRPSFISRGDKSGTHAAELRLWKDAGLEPVAALQSQYKACGCGMGPALNMASSLDAYVLADRGTWLAFKNRGNLVLLVQGDRRLFNPYGVMVVSASRHPHVKAAWAQQFVDWLTAPAGQAAISSYRIHGEPLFFADAKR
jgi:tungstate transport system substrate-binding protein